MIDRGVQSSLGDAEGVHRQHDAGQHVVAGRRESRPPTPEHAGAAVEIADPEEVSHPVDQVVATRQGRSPPARQPADRRLKPTATVVPWQVMPEANGGWGPRGHCTHVDAAASELEPPARERDAVAGCHRWERVHSQVERARGRVMPHDHPQSAGVEVEVDGPTEDRAHPPAPVRRAVPRRPGVEADHLASLRSSAITASTKHASGAVATPAPICPVPAVAWSTPVVILGVTPSSTTRRASTPSGVPRPSSTGIRRRLLRAAHTRSSSSVVARASCIVPPTKAATDGDPAAAAAPNPPSPSTALWRTSGAPLSGP